MLSREQGLEVRLELFHEPSLVRPKQHLRWSSTEGLCPGAAWTLDIFLGRVWSREAKPLVAAWASRKLQATCSSCLKAASSKKMKFSLPVRFKTERG